MEIYFRCKLHDQNTIQSADFGLIHDIVYVCLFLKYFGDFSSLYFYLIKIYFFVIFQENSCNFFRWRGREDVDIQSEFVILQLANKIKKLDTVDESHIKRSTEWGMKEKKKIKCCSIWKLMLVFFVSFSCIFKHFQEEFCRGYKIIMQLCTTNTIIIVVELNRRSFALQIK